MDPLDAEIEAARAELAALRSQPAVAEQPAPTAPTETPWYSPKQLGYDIATGALKAGWGLADLITTPGVALARAGGLDVPYFGISKMGSADLAALAPQVGIQEGTLPQQIVEFATPIPGGGKVDMAKQAGLGLASLLGMKAGEAIAPDSYGGLVGALAAPATITGAARVGAKAAAPLSEALGVVTANEDVLRRAAAKSILEAAGEQGAKSIEEALATGATTGTGGTLLTAAELGQTPGIALRQKAMQMTPEGANILGPAVEQRGAAIAQALEGLGIAPQQGEFALALRDVAEEAAKTKATTEARLLENLGFDPNAPKLSNLEAGAAVQKRIIERADEGYEPVKDAWAAVQPKTKMDVAPQLFEAIKSFNAFGDLTKSRISPIAKDTIRAARDILFNKDGLIRIDEYQDLRASANAALKNATNITDKAEISLMRQLKDNLDSIDSTAIIKGDKGEQVDALTNAIKATKDYYSVFGRGVVGDIIKQRGGELTLKASQVVNRALKNPENIAEIVGKFGRQSDEALVLRNELLDRLAKAKNPTEFLGKNKDLYKPIFESDYKSLVEYAQKVGQKAPFEEFAKITDSRIPNRIFADAKSIEKFVKQFGDTELVQYARSKFISDKLLKSGDAIDNFNRQRQIAVKLFGDDVNKLESYLNDKAIFASPTKLASQATKGQSWTAQMQTALGAVMSVRGLIGAMKKGTIMGGISGIPAGGTIGSAIGALAGLGIEKLGRASESKLNQIEAQMLADPRLLKLATAPATEANVKALSTTMQELGFFGAKATSQEGEASPPAATAGEEPAIDIDAEIEAAKRELESLRGSPMKQDVSFLINDAAERYGVSPKLVNAVVKTESAGKSDAVSPKGAQGLMQLMPKTAKALGVEDPMDPAQNIEGGVKYLAQLIKKFGDEKLALAAYNWGEGNIRKQLDRLAKRDKPQTLAAILKFGTLPTETENYIRKISRLTEEA